MQMIPAIDLKDGSCVRLAQGDMNRATVYSDEAGQTAQRWISAGAGRVHVVDLNGAIEGRPVNERPIRQIIEAAEKVPVQLGGGIRSLKQIETYLKWGLSRAILGTIALENPALVVEACREFPGHVAVGIDANKGRVAVKGWVEVSDVSAVDLAKRFEDAGVGAIIYTDISRDGMLSGPNLEETGVLARSISTPVIASGGVSRLEDIRNLLPLEESGVVGVITGRAIYTGDLDLAEAIAVAEGKP